MNHNFHKKRKDDLFKHNHIQILSVFSLIIVLLFIKALGNTPKFFVNFYGDNKYTSNLYLNDKMINYINQSIYDINSNYKNKDIDYSAYFNNIKIVGKSYIVYDVTEDKIISSKNENDILPLASLTKVVTAITSVKLVGDKDIIIKKELMRPGETFDPGLSEGQRWRMQDLLKYGLTISSNASMDIIANTISSSNQDFVNSMNQYVKELGFEHFTFNSASGLDYGSVIGGKGTALEYAKLFAKSYQLIPNIMSYTTNSKLELSSSPSKNYQILNTNKIANKIVDLTSSKTGYTNAAGGNLSILFNIGLNHPIVIVVLGSTSEDRFTDVKKLYDQTLKIYEYN